MNTMTKDRAIEFIKYLEKHGMTNQKNAYKNEGLVLCVMEICSMSDKEFAKSKYANSSGGNVIHSEYGDWNELHPIK